MYQVTAPIPTTVPSGFLLMNSGLRFTEFGILARSRGAHRSAVIPFKVATCDIMETSAGDADLEAPVLRAPDGRDRKRGGAVGEHPTAADAGFQQIRHNTLRGRRRPASPQFFPRVRLGGNRRLEYRARSAPLVREPGQS